MEALAGGDGRMNKLRIIAIGAIGIVAGFIGAYLIILVAWFVGMYIMGIPEGNPVSNLALFAIRIAALVGGLSIGGIAGGYVNGWFEVSTTPFSEIRKTLIREPPQLTENGYAKAKIAAMEYLRGLETEGNLVTIDFDGEEHSSKSMLRDVALDTAVGRKFVLKYADDEGDYG